MTLLDRRYHPRDLGGEATTRQVTEAIIGNLDC
jgi:isocitrate/isopropylmalate dehydrogenase